MKNYKNLLVAFILGAVFVVFIYHAYVVYQVRAVTIQNAAQIEQIILFLNGGAPADTAASAPATATEE